MKFIHFVIVGLVGISSFVSSAIADELSLRTAFENALRGNPNLQKYSYQLRMAEAEKLQASLRPNPTLGLEFENILGTGESSGFSNGQATLSYSQLIELGDKRKNRVAYASAEQRQIAVEFEYAKNEVLAETALRFYEVLRIQALLRWNQKHLQRLADLHQLAKARVQSAAVPPSEVTRVQFQHRQAEVRGEELQGQLIAAISSLSAMWASKPNFEKVVGEFNNDFHIPSEVAVENAINEAPELLRLLESERLITAKIGSVNAAATADLNLELGVRYNNQVDDAGLVLQASMPLQLTNPKQGTLKANNVEREMVYEQQRLVRDRLRAFSKELLVELQTDVRYLQAVQSDLLPLAQRLEREIKDGYERGTHSLLTVLDAQHELAQQEYLLIERRAAIYRGFLQLGLLTGKTFLGSGL